MPTPPFAQLLRQLPAGVATLEGAELRFGFVNEAMRELVGAHSEGKPLAEHRGSLPESLPGVLSQVLASGKPYTAKACACGPLPGSKDCRYFDLAAEPYHDDRGRVTGLLLLALDVTAQEEARQQAHELALTTRHLDARLRVLTETAPLISFSLDAGGRVTYVSPQWYRFTGQPPTADLTAIWPLLIHPDDRLRVLYQAEAARHAGTGWNHEYRLRRFDGQYRWMLSRALPEVHLPDPPVFWHGALTEIHDQREVAEALRRGEAELRFLADSIPELIWTANAHGLIDYYNQYTTAYSGLTKDELGPTGWVSLLYPEEQPAAARAWVESVTHGTTFEGEYRMRRHDGVYRWHVVRARLLADASGPRWFGACTDIDEHYRLHQVLQTQYDELARAHHDLDTFVYAASHDLKQPTLNLRGLFHELSQAATFHDPDQAVMLRLVDDELSTLEHTLRDLAATVRSQRAQQEPVEVLDLELLLEEVLLGLRPQILHGNAEVEINVTEAPGLLYSRANLRSVAHNLVSNALKFAHPDRPARITLRSYLTPDDHQPVLEVRDNGLGMELDNPDNPTFQLFARQHTHIEGTGVGLYLVQRIVRSQGGHLTVSSTPGEGTTFTIYWTRPE
ncbi:PAS domain-containing protein [Hymenobacter sp. ASUV-10]|uniref:histidine kinase n=1 Tax=Hymenobacter aranciens TaxID=3063996 RepID=A0ABT9BH85_9BACT|nr:PAS domain-containing protein [Hymenobacter sp. ASUV-10]MDO7875878.1 PAS domain-containing protein [Hymenobacter sp. ASUV-10]